MGPRQTLLFAVPLVLACAPSPAQKVGTDMPDLAWTAVHNFGDLPAKRLGELRGSVVLLEFVNTQHESARVEVNKLTQLFRDKCEDGLVVVTVSDEKPDAIARWIKRHELKRPIAVIASGDFEIPRVPNGVLVDKDGKIAWSGHPDLLDRALLDRLLETAKPAVVVAGMEPAAELRRAKDFGGTWKKCKELLDGGTLSPRAAKQARDWMEQQEQAVMRASAAADQAAAAKDGYAQWAALQPIADWYQGVPGAEACKTRLDALLADGKTKREIEAGRKYAVAKEKEAAFDYDGAYAILRELAASFAATKPGKDAAALVKAYEKDGKLGYDHTCGYCKAGGAACPQHRKKKK
jgi:hypothetical protein